MIGKIFRVALASVLIVAGVRGIVNVISTSVQKEDEVGIGNVLEIVGETVETK